MYYICYWYNIVQYDDMLLQLNQGILDSYKQETVDNENDTLQAKIREYIEKRNSSITSDFADRLSLQQEILEIARKLERKADKSDAVYKTVMSFNDNTIQVKARWTMMGNKICTNATPF